MKKILSVFLAGIVLFSFASCGEVPAISDATTERTMRTTTIPSLEETTTVASATVPTTAATTLEATTASTTTIATTTMVTTLATTTATTTAATAIETTTASVVSETLIRNEFKEAMDSYEGFYDEYCEFMMEYQKNPSNLQLLMKYADMMKRLVEMDEKFAAWEEEELTNDELIYYIEVNTRVTQKLLAVAG